MGAFQFQSSACYKFIEVLILAYNESYWDTKLIKITSK